MMYIMKNLNIFILMICLISFGMGLQGCSIEDRTVYLNCPSVDEMTKAYDICMENTRLYERTDCPLKVKQLLCEKKILK